MTEEKVVLVSTIDRIRLVQFNRPHRKNAFSAQMYHEMTEALKEAATDPSIMVLVLTGVGKFFSSGSDVLPSSSSFDVSCFETFVNNMSNFVEAAINFPKLLVANINGPAYGLGCATAALCDIAYASETATFNAAFPVLGLAAEGASSYSFPKIMGYSKAGELLYFNKRLNASHTKECGLVADVYTEEELSTSLAEIETSLQRFQRKFGNIHKTACAKFGPGRLDCREQGRGGKNQGAIHI